MVAEVENLFALAGAIFNLLLTKGIILATCSSPARLLRKLFINLYSISFLLISQAPIKKIPPFISQWTAARWLSLYFSAFLLLFVWQEFARCKLNIAKSTDPPE